MAFDFSEKLIDSDQSATLIVDALNLAFRWKHQGRTDFCSDYVRTVQSLARSYDCGNIIIAADWGNSTYRKEICEDYKQNRKDKFADQTAEEKKLLSSFFLSLKELLMSLQKATQFFASKA